MLGFFPPSFFIFCVVQLSLLLFQVTSCPHVPLGVITWPNQMCLHTCFDYLSFPNVSHPSPIVSPPLPACLNRVLLPFFASLSWVFFAAVQPFLFSSCTSFLPHLCQPVLIEFNFVPPFNCFADTSENDNCIFFVINNQEFWITKKNPDPEFAVLLILLLSAHYSVKVIPYQINSNFKTH